MGQVAELMVTFPWSRLSSGEIPLPYNYGAHERGPRRTGCPVAIVERLTLSSPDTFEAAAEGRRRRERTSI
jgi:hypothetical protein